MPRCACLELLWAGDVACCPRSDIGGGGERWSLPSFAKFLGAGHVYPFAMQRQIVSVGLDVMERQLDAIVYAAK
jgi:hypothetical protein